MDQPLGRAEFATALASVREQYWDRHPFQVRLHTGLATPDDVRRWVANRWYYQECLTQKNAAIVAKLFLPVAWVLQRPFIERKWIRTLWGPDGMRLIDSARAVRSDYLAAQKLAAKSA